MHAIAIRAPAAFRFAFITQRRQRNSRATDWIALAEAWSSRDGNIGAAYCHHGPIGGKKNFAMVVEQRVDCHSPYKCAGFVPTFGTTCQIADADKEEKCSEKWPENFQKMSLENVFVENSGIFLDNRRR
tara:strand:- start:89 stop:475 length:387 start_codon:yes stop_codon:yes gene_type:complete